jgi:hypothetical protein
MALMAAATLGAGCAGFSADGGIGPAQRAARDHLRQELVWVRSDADRERADARVVELLR